MKSAPFKKRSIIGRAFDRLARRLRPRASRSIREDLHGIPKPEVTETLASRMKRVERCLANLDNSVAFQKHIKPVIEGYLDLEDDDRYRWMQLIVGEFDIDTEDLHDQMIVYLSTHRRDLLGPIREQMTAPWERLLERMHLAPGGLEFLFGLRADLLRLKDDGDALDGLDRVLRRLISLRFHSELPGFRRIFRSDLPRLIKPLVDYGTLHETHSPEQLESRLDSDHYCFALFHPNMPDEPLLFGLVALVDGTPDNIHDLLDDTLSMPASDTGRTVTLYSVSRVRAGLEGIGLENLLVERLVNELDTHFGKPDACVALAPIPGFRNHVRKLASGDPTPLLSPEEAEELREFLKIGIREQEHEILESSKLFQPMLSRLCAHYLLHEKDGRVAADPVAHFHLSVGAGIDRINWLGDHSRTGMNQSFGIMVNYRYAPSELRDNREKYVLDGEIRHSSGIRGLL